VFARETQGQPIGNAAPDDDIRLRERRGRKREERDASGEPVLHSNRHAQGRPIAERRCRVAVALRIDLEVVDDVVLPVRVPQVFRHVDGVGEPRGVRRLCQMEPHVCAVGHQHRQHHCVVRQQRLRDGGDAVDDVAQRAGVGQRSQGGIEQFQLCRLLAQRRSLPALLRQPLVRQRQRHVIRDPSSHHRI
jgi:hypothetical protein